MKKLTLSLTIAALLSGCSQSPNDNRIIEDKPRIRFSPANAKILASQDNIVTAAEEFSFPNDLYLTEKDGTSASLKLDGASVSAPIYVHLDLKDEVEVDESSITEKSVKLYKVTLNGPLTTDTTNRCDKHISTALTLCEKKSELTFVDINAVDNSANEVISTANLKAGTLENKFTARSINGGKTLEIRPLFPLEPKTSYLVVITDALKDKNGRSFEYSYDTELMLRGHFTTGMLNTVQKIIQSQITTLTKNKNWSTALKTHRVIYTAPFTTTSGEEVFSAIKGAIKKSNTEPAYKKYKASLDKATINKKTDRVTKAHLTSKGAVSANAEVYSAKLTLPTFSPRNASSLEDLNKNYWSAKGTSAIVFLQYIQTLAPTQKVELMTQIGVNNSSPTLAYNIKVALTVYNGDRTPENLKKLQDELNKVKPIKKLDGKVIDPSLNVTRYNPLPAIPSNAETKIDVQITVPKTADTNLPVVVLLHGITSRKEEMLGLANSYAAKGIATVAIDLPLHGERWLKLNPSFDVNDDGSDDDYATASERDVFGNKNSGYSSLVFMNLRKMLVVRDNLRQGISDVLALRYALESLGTFDSDSYGFDTTKIGLHGFSLGGIIATSAAAYSEKAIDTDGDLDVDKDDKNYFSFEAVALSSPGMGLGNMLYSSPHFSNDIKNALAARFDVIKDTPKFDAIVRAFVVSSQSAIDVGEPTISGNALRKRINDDKLKTLLVQVKGDTVIGNTVLNGKQHHPEIETDSNGNPIGAANFSPVSGTTPMAGHFKLNKTIVDDFSSQLQIDKECTNGCFLEITNETKLSLGKHSSLLVPTSEAETAVIDFFETNLK